MRARRADYSFRRCGRARLALPRALAAALSSFGCASRREAASDARGLLRRRPHVYAERLPRRLEGRSAVSRALRARFRWAARCPGEALDRRLPPRPRSRSPSIGRPLRAGGSEPRPDVLGARRRLRAGVRLARPRPRRHLRLPPPRREARDPSRALPLGPRRAGRAPPGGRQGARCPFAGRTEGAG